MGRRAMLSGMGERDEQHCLVGRRCCHCHSGAKLFLGFDSMNILEAGWLLALPVSFVPTVFLAEFILSCIR